MIGLPAPSTASTASDRVLARYHRATAPGPTAPARVRCQSTMTSSMPTHRISSATTSRLDRSPRGSPGTTRSRGRGALRRSRGRFLGRSQRLRRVGVARCCPAESSRQRGACQPAGVRTACPVATSSASASLSTWPCPSYPAAPAISWRVLGSWPSTCSMRPVRSGAYMRCISLPLSAVQSFYLRRTLQRSFVATRTAASLGALTRSA